MMVHLMLKIKKLPVLGGDTAMDCVKTAVRQNAQSVVLYRRDQEKYALDLLEKWVTL